MAVQWRAMFTGKHPFITVDVVKRKAVQMTVKGARMVSYLDVNVAASRQVTARVD
ncbi:hypothetical protein [Dyadobacter sp. NIV53]|uniref:hypothetical protein n=1 Tax=Dyadobacter sp. NIV53 TaxID=2861765 RepID=UPI001C87F48B|nr:hypothetical protein [Dyadobacter sp. NIV53]